MSDFGDKQFDCLSQLRRDSTMNHSKPLRDNNNNNLEKPNFGSTIF